MLAVLRAVLSSVGGGESGQEGDSELHRVDGGMFLARFLSVGLGLRLPRGREGLETGNDWGLAVSMLR